MDSVSPGSSIPLRTLRKPPPEGQVRCCPVVELPPSLHRALNPTPSTAEKWKHMHTLSFALDCRDTACHLKAKQGKGLSESTVSIPVTFQLVC